MVWSGVKNKGLGTTRVAYLVFGVRGKVASKGRLGRNAQRLGDRVSSRT